MPFDWITYLLMNNKPHTDATKAKMRLSHAEVSKRPEIVERRSIGGFTRWEPENRDAQRQSIKEGIRRKREREREEQDKRNEINRARVEAHLKGKL